MKKSLALVAFWGIVLSSCAQTSVQSNIPSVVSNSFQQKFSNATKVEWETKGEVYNVEFDMNSNEHEVWMDAKGKVIKHKEDLKLTQVPTNIKEAAKRDFPDYKIDDADKYISDGKTTYVLELDKGTFDKSGVEWKVTYDSSGKQLSKVQD